MHLRAQPVVHNDVYWNIACLLYGGSLCFDFKVNSGLYHLSGRITTLDHKFPGRFGMRNFAGVYFLDEYRPTHIYETIVEETNLT